MGLVMKKADVDTLRNISERERAPFYIIGEVTGDMQFTLENPITKEKPIDLALSSLFGDPPKTIMNDVIVENEYKKLKYSFEKINEYIEQVLQLEEVACKDWLTNK